MITATHRANRIASRSVAQASALYSRYANINILTPVEKNLSLINWMVKHRVKLAADKAFDQEAHKYIIPIYEDTGKEIVVCKAGQIGISEYLISYLLWSADIRQATGLYVLPNDGLVSDFSAARLGAAVEANASPYLAKLIMAANGRNRGVDRTTLKRIRDSYLYFRGATINNRGLAPQLDSIDADVLALDEYDKMDSRAPAFAVQRLGHSQIAEVRKVSTPTFAGLGIHAEYLESDGRVWMIPCSHCGNEQDLTLDDLVLEWDEAKRPVAWNQKDGEPYLACRKCKKPLDRLASGRWVAQYPDRLVHGYHLSRLFVPHKPLVDIITGLQETDETQRQQTYNQALGLPYESPHAQSLTDEILNRCRRKYILSTPVALPLQYEEGKPKIGRVVAGIDVGTILHIVIRERLDNGDWAARFIGEVSTFEDVLVTLQRYGVKLAVCDALPERRSAEGFQATARAKPYVFLCFYTQGLDSTDIAPIRYDWPERTVKADRTRTLDGMMARFLEASMDEPGATLPASAHTIPDYYAQMKAMSRVYKDNKTGNKVATYVEKGPDHFAMAENYCYIASQIKGGTLH